MQTSDSADFQALLDDIKTSNLAAEIPLHGHSQFFWRVCFVANNPLSGLCSIPRSVTVESKPAPPPPLPPLEIPHMNDLRQNLTYSPKNTANPVTLNWSKIEGASEYHLQISNSANFKKILVDEKPKASAFTWNHPQPGIFFARAQALDATRPASVFAKPAKIELSIDAPQITSNTQLTQVINNPQELNTETETTLSWKPHPAASSYRVQLSDSINFTSSQSRQVSSGKTQLKLKSGHPIFARITALDGSGAAISPTSKPSEISVTKTLRLLVPEVIAPLPDTKVVSLVANSPILFTWKAPKFKAKFDFQVSRDERFSQILASKTLERNNFILQQNPKNKIPKIYWRVRTRYNDNASDWTSPSSLELVVSK